MELSRVILKPVYTEKSQQLKEQDPHTYAFYVDPKATKTNIKIAFFSIFNVSPASVRTVTRKPAWIRTGTMKPGKTKLQKIAYITLDKGQEIFTSQQELEEASKDASKETKKEEAPAAEAKVEKTEAKKAPAKKAKATKTKKAEAKAEAKK